MNSQRSLIVCALVLAASAVSSSAHAFDGWIAGSVTYYQNSGQFCNSGIQTCTGARYLSSEFQTQRPVREAIVEIVDQSGNPLGRSATLMDGGFLVRWISGSMPSSVKVRLIWEHKDHRYSIRSRNSGDPGTGWGWYTESGSFTVTNGGSVFAPAMNFGDNQIFNAYENTFRMWNDALVYVGIMSSRFTTLCVMSPDPDMATGRAQMDSTIRGIRLGNDSAYYPISDVHHELGHLTHWSAKLDGSGNPELKFCVAYNYNSSCNNVFPSACSGDHDMQSAEHKCSQFEEGAANFIGLVASYWWDATQPLFCVNERGSCAATGVSSWDIERRTAGSCVTDEDRWELSVTRYMWDLYDSRVDTDYNDADGANTSSTFSYSNLVGIFANYTSGNGWGQVNEPFDNAGKIDNSDGRSGWLYGNTLGSGGTQRTNNCTP